MLEMYECLMLFCIYERSQEYGTKFLTTHVFIVLSFLPFERASIVLCSLYMYILFPYLCFIIEMSKMIKAF